MERGILTPEGEAEVVPHPGREQPFVPKPIELLTTPCGPGLEGPGPGPGTPAGEGRSS